MSISRGGALKLALCNHNDYVQSVDKYQHLNCACCPATYFDIVKLNGNFCRICTLLLSCHTEMTTSASFYSFYLNLRKYTST
jgi:hypothetical protein